MKKIPTMFVRDWEGDRSRVLDEITPGCEWVAAGEGHALRKYDGTCVAVLHGKLFKRRELKAAQKIPDPTFVRVEEDLVTGKVVGWVVAGSGPEDRWLREAAAEHPSFEGYPGVGLADGTYELIGPKIQGNPEGFERHELVRHDLCEGVGNLDRSFEGIRAFLSEARWEGIVFHHPDGRMVKIKGRDFGLKR